MVSAAPLRQLKSVNLCKLLPKFSNGVNAAGGAPASGSRQSGRKRREAMASIAALVVGLASLVFRIAELVGEMN